MLRYTQKWVKHWYFKFWVFTFWNLSPKIKCTVALTKVFFIQIFLHFGQFYFCSRQVCSKWLTNWTAIDIITLNGFTRNAKHGFDSWKSSNLAWNSSSSLTLYRGLQLSLREKHSFSLRSLSCDLGSLCCNLSGGVALIVWFTTNGMCVKNNTIHMCGANKQ